jgi:plasmid stabilization system protein ParE
LSISRRSIATSLSKESPDAADRFIAELWRKIQFYALTPEIGLPRPDLADDLRSFTFKRHYVVIYRPEADGLHVLRVFHGSRDYPALI